MVALAFSKSAIIKLYTSSFEERGKSVSSADTGLVRIGTPPNILTKLKYNMPLKKCASPTMRVFTLSAVPSLPKSLSLKKTQSLVSVYLTEIFYFHVFDVSDGN
jgi:hypothetical protein